MISLNRRDASVWHDVGMRIVELTEDDEQLLAAAVHFHRFG